MTPSSATCAKTNPSTRAKDAPHAWATATSVDADILLIDEALAVGDAAFQRKSGARIDGFRRAGVTCVVVSHDVRRLAELCDRIVWLDRGRVVDVGESGRIVQRYLATSA